MHLMEKIKRSTHNKKIMVFNTPFLEEVFDHIEYLKEKKNCDIPFFRGHACKEWLLVPSLFRDIKEKIGDRYRSPEEQEEQLKNLENVLFYDFRSLGAPHIDAAFDSWDILFLMRHFGLPTRILDWTENFNVALFFALYDKEFRVSPKIEPCIWILNPFELNKYSINKKEILELDEMKNISDYTNYFKSNTKKFNNFTQPVAIYPKRNVARVFSQKCTFTLHFSDMKPIEKICKNPDIIKKFEISQDDIEDLKKFLSLSGINEYSVYPDLQGLSDYLVRTKIDER